MKCIFLINHKNVYLYDTAMFLGIQVHIQDVHHPFPTMLSCI